MEENNKYQMKKDCKVCVFCKTGQDNIMNYIEKCVEVKE